MPPFVNTDARKIGKGDGETDIPGLAPGLIMGQYIDTRVPIPIDAPSFHQRAADDGTGRSLFKHAALVELGRIHDLPNALVPPCILCLATLISAEHPTCCTS